jgi:hypothetical protein
MWAVILLLSALLLLYPTNLTSRLLWNAQLFDTTEIFGNFTLFAIVFFVWSLTMGLLSVSTENIWEGAGLTTVFAAVFIGFWIVNTPLRLDGISNAALLENTLQTHSVVPLELFIYSEYPALTLLSAQLSTMTGLSTPVTIALLLWTNLLTFGVLTSVVLNRQLKSSALATFATVFLIGGNIYISRSYAYYPGSFALTLLLVYILLCQRSMHKHNLNYLLIATLFASVVTMHMATAICILFIHLGISIVRSLRKQLPTIVLMMTMLLLWGFFYGTRIMFLIVENMRFLVEDFLSTGKVFWSLWRLQSNVGSVPTWVGLTRTYWVVIVLVPGMLVTAINLLRIRRLDNETRLLTGVIIGTITMSISVTIVSMGGEQFVRFLQFTPFFTVPTFLTFLWRSRKKTMFKYLLVFLIVSTFLLSLPTFLAHSGRVGTETYYRPEFVSAQFLGRSFKDGKGLRLLNNQGAELYYLPRADFQSNPLNAGPTTESMFLKWCRDIAYAFAMSDHGTVLEESGRFHAAIALVGLDIVDTPEWNAFLNVTSASNRVYDVGLVQFFAH